jgi:hypothetical protein
MNFSWQSASYSFSYFLRLLICPFAFALFWREACRIPIDGLGDLVRKIFPHQVVSAVAVASDPPSGFRGSWKYLCGAIFSARLNWRGSESRAAGNLLAHHSLYVGRMDALGL